MFKVTAIESTDSPQAATAVLNIGDGRWTDVAGAYPVFFGSDAYRFELVDGARIVLSRRNNHKGAPLGNAARGR